MTPVDKRGTVPAKPAPSKKGDLNDAVYRSIKELILSGRLRPGVRLVHQDLADQLAVSRTPVRESLERLLQEGYAGRWPRRGYFVAELDASDVAALYETREALELFALRKTCRRGFTRSEIAGLRALNKSYAAMFPEAMSRNRLHVDQQFHLKLAGYAGNPFLCSTLDVIFEKTNLKRRLDGHALVVGNTPLRDHQALVAAIEERRFDDAETTLQSHIRDASVRLLRHLELNGAAFTGRDV